MQRQLIATVLAVGFIAITSSGVRGAGTNAADETAIRKQIAANDVGTGAGLSLPDAVFWSAALKRPKVGNEKGEPTIDRAAEDRVPGSQKSTTTVIRVVVADSHDLAYEYSTSNFAYDVKGGKHVSFDRGLLRVWQKQGGDWKIAAFFVRPYDK
jgi:ketosteroid isomerase-like protein